MTKPSKQCDTPISVLKKGQKFGNSRQGGITLVLIHSCSKALQNTWIFFSMLVFSKRQSNEK